MSDGKKYLTKEQILAAPDLPIKEVCIPEWGNLWVCVQGLTGSERDSLEASIVVQKGKNVTANLQNLRAKMVQRCVVDPSTRKLLFSPGDIAALGNKSATALQRVFDVARELSGMGDADVQELTGNSESGLNGGSGSGSL